MNAYFLATMNVNLCGVTSLLFCRTLWGEAHVLKHHSDAIINTEAKAQWGEVLYS